MVHASNELCVPNNVGSEQMRKVVLGQLANRGISRNNYNETGLDLAFDALKDAWPCKQFNYDPVKD
jgi:hypothetical protein